MIGKILPVAVILLACSSAGADLLPLDQAEMQSVTGREGIAVEMDFRVNANADGSVDASVPLVERRIALQFANRADKWLVLKDYHGRIYIPALNLNAARTPIAATPYEDLNRYKDENGVPLLASPHDIPVLQMTYPKGMDIYDLTIGGMAIEYGATGYSNASAASFVGLKVGNSIAGQPAHLDMQGKVYMYGF